MGLDLSKFGALEIGHLAVIALTTAVSALLFIGFTPPWHSVVSLRDGVSGTPWNTMVSNKNCCEEVTPIGPGIELGSSPIQYQYDFPNALAENKPLTVFVALPAEGTRLDINSLIVRSQMTLSARPFSQSRLMQYRVPQAWIHPGTNRLYMMQLNEQQARQIGYPVLGIDQAQTSAYSANAGHFVQSTLFSAAALIAILMLIVFASRLSSLVHGGEFVMALSFLGATGLAAFGSSTAFSEVLDVQFGGALFISLLAAGFLLARGAETAHRKFAIASWVATIVATAAFAMLTFASVGADAPLVYLLAKLALVAAIGMQVFEMWSRQDRIIENWLAATGLAFFLAIDLAYPSDRLAAAVEAISVATILVALALLATRRGREFVRELWQWLQNQASLARQVALQKQKIETISSDLEFQIKRSAVLEERQRLMRDMHDGIGGQLISLLTRIRRGKVDIDDVENEVEAGLNDLRLVVNALDSKDQSLAEAFAKLRYRIEAQANAAGVELVWDQLDEFSDHALAPRELLNLTRLMQEVFTNAFKHSQANKITLVTSIAKGEPALELRIEDDGLGIDERAVESGHGAGLANIQTRTLHLGGKAMRQTGADGKGLRWEFEIPLERI